MNDRLKLLSESKDVKLASIECVVHGTANEASSQQILGVGFQYLVGRPSISTNLIHALDWTINPLKHEQSLESGHIAGEPGRLILMRVPAGVHLGYGVFTSAYIDRRIKRVGGAPLRYAAARKQLAFYASADVVSGRQLIEDAIMGGADWHSQPMYSLDPGVVLATIKPSPTTTVLIGQLAASIADFNPIETDKIANYLAGEAELYGGTATELAAALHGLITGTAESVIISRLRMMRWQGLKGIGYSIYEGQDEANAITAIEPRDQLSRIEAFEQRLASSRLFDGELNWLKAYAINSLAVIRLELEG